jgi:hypothetical protein
MDFEDYLRQFRLREPDGALRGRVLRAAAEPAPAVVVRWKAWAGVAAAAALVAAAGLSLWLNRGPVERPIDRPDSLPLPALASTGSVPLFEGRGLLIPVGSDAEYTVIDAAAGRVRLSRGEIYLEVPSDEGVHAEIETPAGTAASPGSQGYVRYAGDEPARTGPMLTVSVIGGSIEVRNRHGRMTGDAGETVVAEDGRAPSRQGGGPGPSHRGGFGGFAPGGSAWLLHRGDVQAELKLTEDQKGRLSAVAKADWNGMRTMFEALQKVPREERAARVNEFHASLAGKRTDVLTPEQDKRLRQIALQQEGIGAILRRSNAEALALSEDQRRRIESTLRESGEATAALSRGPGRGSEDSRRKRAELRRRTAETVLGVLTDEQRARWKDMTGEPFALAPVGFPPMFGPPPGVRKDSPRRDTDRRDGDRRDGRPWND